MTNEITKKEENGFSTLKSEELFDIEGGDAEPLVENDGQGHQKIGFKVNK